MHKAIENAGRILKETRCQAVKLESGAEQAEVIAALVAAGIPVMAHCGLRPQNIHQLGGYRVQRDERQLLADAQAAEHAGAFAIVLECIPAETAGPHYVLGNASPPSASAPGRVATARSGVARSARPEPRSRAASREGLRRFEEDRDQAVTQYRDEVRDATFPAKEHTFA